MTLHVANIILPATDLSAQAAFYQNVLGLPVVAGSVVTGSIDFAAENLRITINRRSLSSPATPAPKLVFGTAQVEQLHATLVERGARLGPIVVNGPLHQAEGTDPEGNPFMISNLGQAQPPAAPTPAPPPARPDMSSTMIWDTPVSMPTPAFAFVDPALTKEVEHALSSNPDVFIQTLKGYPGLAVVFRDLLTRLNHSRQESIEDWELEVILKSLGGVGMMATIGKRHRRIVVFDTGKLVLSPSKMPLPVPLDLASHAVYPLGVGN